MPRCGKLIANARPIPTFRQTGRTSWPFAPMSCETCAGQRLHHVLIVRSRKETVGHGLEQGADKLVCELLSTVVRSDRNLAKLRSFLRKTKATSPGDVGS